MCFDTNGVHSVNSDSLSPPWVSWHAQAIQLRLGCDCWILRWILGRQNEKTKPPRFATSLPDRSDRQPPPFFVPTFGHHFGERIKGCIGNISLWMNCHTGQGATGKGFCMDRDQAVLHCQTCQGVTISEGLCFNSLNSPQGRTRGMSEMPRQNASPTKVYKTHQNTPTHVQSFDCLFWLTIFVPNQVLGT